MIYLSLGAGVQSSALYLASDRGLWGVPKADIAIFADTQSEPRWVYETLDALRDAGSIEIYTVTAGNLGADLMNKAGAAEGDQFASIPAFTPSSVDPDREALLRRQCTREYKLTPIQNAVRELLGYKPRQRIPDDSATAIIGISLDEVYRVRPSRVKWITNTYPLIEAGKYRSHCRTLVADLIGYEPKRSACYFCPYRRNSEWRDIRDNDPESWRAALELDAGIRSMTKAGVDGQVFLHRSMKPLSVAPIEEPDTGQGDLFNEECEGMCGV